MSERIITRFLTDVTSRLMGGLLFVVSVFGILFILTPVPVHAQEVGFTQCQFNTQSQSAGDVSIQNCLGQIFQFTFVVGMFIIAIRVAILAIGNYNPFDNGKAVNQTIGLVWEVTLGFILLGSPVLLINVINPAALNLSFLQLGTVITNQGGNTGGTDTGGSGDQTGGSSQQEPEIETDNGARTPGEVDDAVDQLEGGSTGISPSTFLATLNLVTAQAQDSSELNDEEAIRIISDVLLAELQCNKLLVRQVDLSNCRSLDTPEFIQSRNRINTRLRELYTPLIEPSKTYTGTLYNTREFEILPISIEASASSVELCSVRYASIRVIQNSQTHLLATEFCQDAQFNSLIWSNQDGVINANLGEVVPEGSTVLQNGTISILN